MFANQAALARDLRPVKCVNSPDVVLVDRVPYRGAASAGGSAPPSERADSLASDSTLK